MNNTFSRSLPIINDFYHCDDDYSNKEWLDLVKFEDESPEMKSTHQVYKYQLPDDVSIKEFIDKYPQYLSTILILCIFQQRADTMGKLIETYHYDIATHGNKLIRAFCSSGSFGNIGIIKYLLEHGVTLGPSDEEYLKYGLAHSESAITKLLIEYGADIHMDDDYPLRKSIFLDHTDTIMVLIKAGANIHAGNNRALIISCINENCIIAKMLLEYGINIHAYQDQALYNAVCTGCYQLVKLLLDYEADVHAENDRALVTSIIYNYYTIAQLLLASGADVQANNNESLIIALSSYNISWQLIKLLVDYGADLEAINHYPFELDTDAKEIIELFISKSVRLEKLLVLLFKRSSCTTKIKN